MHFPPGSDPVLWKVSIPNCQISFRGSSPVSIEQTTLDGNCKSDTFCDGLTVLSVVGEGQSFREVVTSSPQTTSSKSRGFVCRDLCVFVFLFVFLVVYAFSASVKYPCFLRNSSNFLFRRKENATTRQKETPTATYFFVTLLRVPRTTYRFSVLATIFVLIHGHGSLHH